MTTYTLTGNLGDLVGVPLTSPTGAPARAYLVPYYQAAIESGEVRIGPIELTLDAADTFTQAGVPAGAYQVNVRYFSPAARQMVTWAPPYFELTGGADLSTVLTLPAYNPGGVGSVDPSVVLVSSANSGTAYTITAQTHGEKRLKLTLTGNATLTLSGGTSGEVCAVQLNLIQDATGSRTVTWPGSVDWGVAGAPVLSTVATKYDMVYLTTDDGGSSWQGALIGSGY